MSIASKLAKLEKSPQDIIGGGCRHCHGRPWGMFEQVFLEDPAGPGLIRGPRRFVFDLTPGHPLADDGLRYWYCGKETGAAVLQYLGEPLDRTA